MEVVALPLRRLLPVRFHSTLGPLRTLTESSRRDSEDNGIRLEGVRWLVQS
jgi:hypothetical protein